jgi:hypothetical protein
MLGESFGKAFIGLAVPAGRSGPWSRGTGAPDGVRDQTGPECSRSCSRDHRLADETGQQALVRRDRDAPAQTHHSGRAATR